VFEIAIQPVPVARAERLLEKRDFLHHRIEDAGAFLSTQTPLFRTRSVTEQPFERHPWIHFGWKRLRGRAPGDAVRVGATVAPIAIPEIADILDAQLNRFEDSIAAVFLRDQLIDGHTQVRTHGVSTRPGSGQ